MAGGAWHRATAFITTKEPGRMAEEEPGTPFDSIESSYEYVGLLAEALDEAREAIQEEIAIAQRERAERRGQALRIVAYKLEKLKVHIKSSHRILNDLRTLRRLLLQERRARRAAGEATEDSEGA
jgi:hypothetical protein